MVLYIMYRLNTEHMDVIAEHSSDITGGGEHIKKSHTQNKRQQITLHGENKGKRELVTTVSFLVVAI